jgi:uncharacterized membrane protein
MAKEQIIPRKAAASSEQSEQMFSGEEEPPMKQDETSQDRTPEPEHEPFDMNAVIGWILQGGVMLSSFVILVGVVLSFFQAGSRQALVFPHTLVEVWNGLLALQPVSVIALGLLLLLATPVIRVAASIIAFGLEHDRRYVVITSVVLGILIVSFLIGKGAG